MKKSPEQEARVHIDAALEKAGWAVQDPDKVNLASFGNQVPHVHWHVIPRFADDPHFPNPTWGERTGGTAHPVATRSRLGPDIGLCPR